MKLKFQPMPVLTAIVAVMLAILISLGVWQYQRLQWKTDLLAEVEASVTAPPLTSLDDLERAIDAGEPVDFRRISINTFPLKGAPIYHVYRSQTGGIFWDIFIPIEDCDATDRSKKPIFVKGRTVDSAKKEDELNEYPRTLQDTCGEFFGHVRKDHPMGRVESWLKSQPNRTTNRWFKFNQDGSWTRGMPQNVVLSHFIEADPDATSAENLPIRRPTIRNNHRDYMLTWFSFAGLLLIFYCLIHKRAGRLSW